MQRVRRMSRAFLCMTAAGMLAGSIKGDIACPGMLDIYAAEIYTEETLPADWLQEPDADSEAELDLMVEKYLEQMESGVSGDTSVQSDTIVDPVLRLEQAEGGRVKYTLPNQSSFWATVPDGMITTKDVVLEFTDGVMAVAQKDDENSYLVDEPYFTEPGVYHLKMIFYHTETRNGSDYNVYELNYHFTIIDEVDGTLGVVTAPKDFRITEAKKDGVPLTVVRSEAVFLDGDGIYEIRYQDLATGRIHMSTVFERDTTAPFLTFSREFTDGVLAGPVEYYPSEVGAAVIMTYNGNRGPAVSNVLTSGGLYQLEVTDQVGNSRFYHVTVRPTYQFFDKRMIILIFICLGALGLRLLRVRRDMKVI